MAFPDRLTSIRPVVSFHHGFLWIARAGPHGSYGNYQLSTKVEVIVVDT